MKPDQKAQQTQLDELLAFIEECQGEPVNDEIRTNDQEKHHKHPTSQGTEEGGEENNIESVDNQLSTNVCEPPSTPVRMRRTSSISEQKTPSRQTRLSARKRNSHIMESEEQEMEREVKIARVDAE